MRDKLIKKLIELNPNDADLGASIKEIYKKGVGNKKTILRYAIWGGLFYLAIVGTILTLVLLKNY